MRMNRPRRVRRSIVRLAVSCPLLLLALAGAAGLGSRSRRHPHSKRSASARAATDGHRTCFAERVVTSASALQPFATPSGYGPPDLQSAYELSPHASARAAPSRSSTPTTCRPPSPTSATYRSQFGLPPCTTANGCFRKINQNGGTTPPAANAGWGQEIALDIDMVSATCPQLQDPARRGDQRDRSRTSAPP